MNRRHRRFAGQHEAGHLRLVADPLGEDLVDARPRPDRAAGGQRRPGEQVAGLRAVDVPLLGLFVVEAADEEQLLLVGASGWRTLPSSMARPVPLAHHSLLWKPLPEKRQANRTGGWLEALAADGLVAPDSHRFEPGQAPSRRPGRGASPAVRVRRPVDSDPVFMVSLLSRFIW